MLNIFRRKPQRQETPYQRQLSKEIAVLRKELKKSNLSDDNKYLIGKYSNQQEWGIVSKILSKLSKSDKATKYLIRQLFEKEGELNETWKRR